MCGNWLLKNDIINTFCGIRALPTETKQELRVERHTATLDPKVESGTSQSKSGSSFNWRSSENTRRVHTRQQCCPRIWKEHPQNYLILGLTPLPFFALSAVLFFAYIAYLVIFDSLVLRIRCILGGIRLSAGDSLQHLLRSCRPPP